MSQSALRNILYCDQESRFSRTDMTPSRPHHNVQLSIGHITEKLRTISDLTYQVTPVTCCNRKAEYTSSVLGTRFSIVDRRRLFIIPVQVRETEGPVQSTDRKINDQSIPAIQNGTIRYGTTIVFMHWTLAH